jgi:hypothetical protein
MNLKSLAETHHFRIRTDECGDLIAYGRYGHLYVDHGKLHYCLTDDGRHPFRSAKLINSQERHMGSIVRCHLRGDYEGIYELTSETPAAIRKLIRLCGLPRKRTLSPEQREQCALRLKKYHLKQVAKAS